MADDTFDIKKLMEQAQTMQKKWQSMQGELTKITVTGEAGAGLVKITMNSQAVTEVKIDDEVFTEKKDVLEDLIAAAVNDALNKREKVTQNNLLNMSKNLTPTA
jgi:nucleoid-associated protein EbfC